MAGVRQLVARAVSHHDVPPTVGGPSACRRCAKRRRRDIWVRGSWRQLWAGLDPASEVNGSRWGLVWPMQVSRLAHTARLTAPIRWPRDCATKELRTRGPPHVVTPRGQRCPSRGGDRSSTAGRSDELGGGTSGGSVPRAPARQNCICSVPEVDADARAPSARTGRGDASPHPSATWHSVALPWAAACGSDVLLPEDGPLGQRSVPEGAGGGGTGATASTRQLVPCRVTVTLSGWPPR